MITSFITYDIDMTKDEYKKREAERQDEKSKLARKIQGLGDGLITPAVSTAEGDRLQAEAIQADAALTEEEAQEHKHYSAQSDEDKEPPR